jgi:hypothetical protein
MDHQILAVLAILTATTTLMREVRGLYRDTKKKK